MPRVLILALDGVDRDLLYRMLRKGELPELAQLLFGANGEFPHTHFEPRLLSTLPSSTIAAWTTAFTGVSPAHHGITGNEFFLRETRRFAAPIPGSFKDSAPVIATFTEDYVNDLIQAPTLYERLREREPEIEIWVAMHQIYRGADRLLLTDRKMLVQAFEAYLVDHLLEKLENKTSRKFFSLLDDKVFDSLVEAIKGNEVPDVLTIYSSGTDLYAHVADGGPDPARVEYLKDVLEKHFKELREALAAKGALDDTYVVITSDHGHTEVLEDEAHALATSKDDPPGVLEQAGFRLRPLKLEVAEGDDFQAVLAYQGAIAYVYLADRSLCVEKGTKCNWSKPPRYREDVLEAAEAFFINSETGAPISKMRGTLDLIFVRDPTWEGEAPRPYQVYLGQGRTQPVAEYLAEHPRPEYLALEWRLEDLAVGPLGRHAGDVLLLAHNGDRDEPAGRFYFSERYHSWHGSPSRKDSEIPLIVAHRKHSAAELEAIVSPMLGEKPFQQKVTDVVLKLRETK